MYYSSLDGWQAVHLTYIDCIDAQKGDQRSTDRLSAYRPNTTS